MRTPESMPRKPSHSIRPISPLLDGLRLRTPQETETRETSSFDGVEPAGCLAEVCVDVPLVGRVCHCVAQSPF